MQNNIKILKTLSQKDFDNFATLSGDYNPIHVDPEYALQTVFGKTVAHGAYLVTILRGLTEQLVPGGKQVFHEVKFPAPTYADEKLQFSAALTQHSPNEFHVALEVLRIHSGIITCQGNALIAPQETNHENR